MRISRWLSSGLFALLRSSKKTVRAAANAKQVNTRDADHTFFGTSLASKEKPATMKSKRLTEDSIAQFEEQGYLVVKDLLSPRELEDIRTAIESFVARSAEMEESDETFKLEKGHTKERPLLGRVVCPSSHHRTFWDLQRHPAILDVVEDLLGGSFRYMAQDKLNMKIARCGTAIDWHQDWAFYPHTNDSVLTVCALFDNATTENGCLQVIPGSHRGKLFEHSKDGMFLGRIVDDDFDINNAVSLEAPAGSITIHHSRTAHGSQANTSEFSRRAVCNIYCAADAWPLLGVAGRDFSNVGPVDWDVFRSTMLRGEPSRFPRLRDVPVALPLPLRDIVGVFKEEVPPHASK